MKKLVEIIESDLQLEEAPDSNWYLGTLKFAFAKGDFKNANGRIYNSSLLQREVARLNTKIKESPISGMLEHNPEGLVRLDRVSHVITKATWDETNKSAWAEAKILKTQKGQDLKVLLNTVSLGASMVGYGSVSKDGVIEADYEIKSIDLVANPSFGKHAQVSGDNLIESLNSVLEQNDDRQVKIAQLARELVQSGGTKHKIKSVEDYFKPYPLPGKSETKKVQEKLFPQTDSKEKALYLEEKKAGFIGSFKEWKERHLIKE